jgi:uncharacterized protein
MPKTVNFYVVKIRRTKMARPKKWRKVCCLPENSQFGPLNAKNNQENYITMTVDEYETIRLIDLEGFTQEECANQMNVARSTVQGIYNDARKKLAESLVNGNVLWIDGGEYQLCDGNGKSCRRGSCGRRRCSLGVMEDDDGNVP